MTDEVDYTDKYNTALNVDETQKFTDWSSQQNRDVNNDKFDYDIQGWWQKNQDQSLDGGHLTDQWKKPNHPTFSDQSQYNGVDGQYGGTWQPQSNGSFNFLASETNTRMMDPSDLSDYFKKVEPGNNVLFNP